MPRTILVIAPLAAVLIAVGAMFLAGSGAPGAGAGAIAERQCRGERLAEPGAFDPPTRPPHRPYPLAAGEAWIVHRRR